MDLGNNIIPFHWSSYTIGSTIAGGLMLIGGILLMIFLKQYSLWIRVPLGCILGITLLVSLYFLPISLVVGNENITIKCLVNRTVIPKSTIKRIYKIKTNNSFHSKREFGSSGAFGLVGIFSNDMLGKFTMYATELETRIVIETESKNYVISCSEWQKLITE